MDVAGMTFLRNLEKLWTMHAAAARTQRFFCAVARPAPISHPNLSGVSTSGRFDLNVSACSANNWQHCPASDIHYKGAAGHHDVYS